MGILGNNSQTVLEQKNSTVADTVTDTQPGVIAKSGYSEGTTPKSGTARETPPDDDLSLQQPAEGPPSNENADGVQQTNSSDSKRQAKCEEKIALMKPDPNEFINSSLKGIQTVIENLTSRLDAILQSLQSYADAITSGVEDAQAAIEDIIQLASREISKFMKPIFDKIQEYSLKIMNQGFNAIIAALPSSMRFQFKDTVQISTELMLCMYNEMTGSTLKDQIAGALEGAIDTAGLLSAVEEAVENGDPEVGAPTNPQVPMCAAEALVAQVISMNMEEIDTSNNALIDNLNAYLDDANEMLSGITGFENDISTQIDDIVGSMTGALSFTNFAVNIFPCELSPTVAESDTYTFCSGGDQTAPLQQPSSKSVEEGIESASEITDIPDSVPYLEPDKSQSNLELDQDTQTVLAAEDAALEKALQDSTS